jgi:hypothetical protein
LKYCSGSAYTETKPNQIRNEAHPRAAVLARPASDTVPVLCYLSILSFFFDIAEIIYDSYLGVIVVSVSSVFFVPEVNGL